MSPARSRKNMSNHLIAVWTAWRRKHAAIHKSMQGRRWGITVCLAFLVSSAVAQPSVGPATEAAKRYPKGAIQSVSDADDALNVVGRERAAIESRYTQEEQECHPKFFATSCIEQAKERRRKATMELRAVENAANVYKRRARVEERDKAVEEKRLQAETDRMDRIRLPKEADQPGAQQEKPLQSVETGVVKPQASPSPGRKERHQEKLSRLQSEETAKAEERAEKVAKYEKKVQAAKARQQEVAAKKAEKEQKRRLKEAQAAESKK